MRLKHIYITKEGEPMANPDMEYPTLYFISGGHEVARTDLDEALAIYHSGLLPFEDRDDVKLAVNDYHSAKDEAYLYFDGIHLKPDTLVPVDLEVEVVEQEKSMSSDEWIDYTPGYLRGAEVYAIRKVLRIKP